MLPRKSVLILLVIGILALSACAPTGGAQTEAATGASTQALDGKAIVIGDIGDDPTEIIEGTQPLADYLASQLGDYGITRGEVKVAQTDKEMIEWIKNGEVDLYFDSVYPATLILDDSGAKPLVRRWSRGVAEYHTVIFVSKSSGIKTLEDLKGHMLAFDQLYSTSGYLLPLAYLVESDLNPARKCGPEEAVGANEVGFVFSEADDNTVNWVLSDLVSGGATDNVRYGRLEQDVRDQFIVLAETESLPRQVGLVRPGMDKELEAAIKKALLETDQSEEGRAALESFAKTAKFDDFPEGIDAAFDRIHELIDLVRSVEGQDPC